MSEDEINELFEGIPNRHLFRHWQSHIRHDLVKLNKFFQKDSHSISKADLEWAIQTLFPFKLTLLHIFKILKSDELYPSTQRATPYPTHVDFLDYDTTYYHFLNIVIPSIVGAKFALDLRWRFLTEFNGLMGFCILTLETQSFYQAQVKKDFTSAVDCFRRFSALVNAAAEFERQQFGEVTDEQR